MARAVLTGRAVPCRPADGKRRYMLGAKPGIRVTAEELRGEVARVAPAGLNAGAILPLGRAEFRGARM